MIILEVLGVIFVGFAGGFAVGSGFVAFLTVLGIIPRLAQLTKMWKYIHWIEWAVISGAVVNGWLSLQDSVFYFSPYLIIPIGLGCGVFIGMLAAALTEIVNVFPLLMKRIGVEEKMVYFLMAIALGKITGSLFHWIYFIQ